MVLLIDNFDSFTYNLWHLALVAGLECEVHRSDSLSMDLIRAMQPEGIILSPGPGRPEEHGLMSKVIEAYSGIVPILGVCLGMQALALHNDGSVIPAPEVVHGVAREVIHSGHPMFRGIPVQFMGARYHSLCVSLKIPGAFKITAQSMDGIPMAMADDNRKIWAVQYHPEAIETQHGLQLMVNWAGHFTPSP